MDGYFDLGKDTQPNIIQNNITKIRIHCIVGTEFMLNLFQLDFFYKNFFGLRLFKLVFNK
jgi:hypothetical protein